MDIPNFHALIQAEIDAMAAPPSLSESNIRPFPRTSGPAYRVPRDGAQSRMQGSLRSGVGGGDDHMSVASTSRDGTSARTTPRPPPRTVHYANREPIVPNPHGRMVQTSNGGVIRRTVQRGGSRSSPYCALSSMRETLRSPLLTRSLLVSNNSTTQQQSSSSSANTNSTRSSSPPPVSGVASPHSDRSRPLPDELFANAAQLLMGEAEDTRPIRRRRPVEPGLGRRGEEGRIENGRVIPSRGEPMGEEGPPSAEHPLAHAERVAYGAQVLGEMAYLAERFFGDGTGAQYAPSGQVTSRSVSAGEVVSSSSTETTQHRVTMTQTRTRTVTRVHVPAVTTTPAMSDSAPATAQSARQSTSHRNVTRVVRFQELMPLNTASIARRLEAVERNVAAAFGGVAPPPTGDAPASGTGVGAGSRSGAARSNPLTGNRTIPSCPIVLRQQPPTAGGEEDPHKLEAQKRLRKEAEMIRKFAPMYCSAAPREDDLFRWSAVIEGPKGSVYEGGTFFIDIQFNEYFPKKAPKVMFLTRIYHCNVNNTGSTWFPLVPQWAPENTVAELLQALVDLMCNPLLDAAMVDYIAKQYVQDRALFDETARIWTRRYAT